MRRLETYIRSGLWLAWLLYAAGIAHAQVDINLIDTDPPGIRIFNLGQFTLTYEVIGTANGVQVDFFRDDGMGQVTVAIPDPANPAPPFMVVLPLKTNVDRVGNSFTAVVRDLVTDEIDLAGPFTVFSDDIGPEPPTISQPVFPVVTFADSLRIDGLVNNTQAGIPTLPETEGSVIIQRMDNNLVIGGGPITTSSNFTALADLSSFVFDTPTMIDIFAVDAVGNFGTTLTVEVTRMMAGDPVVTATLEPVPGTITRDPGVVIRGSVVGDLSPLTVSFFVDGLLESQVSGLASGDMFLHTLNMPGEGFHTFAVQGTNPGSVPNSGLASGLGSITLDRTPPQAPVILNPDPLLGTLVTNQPTFTIEGFSTERDTVVTDTFMPTVLFQGPPGVTFDPPPPVSLDSATGRFLTTADISALPDGSFFVDVILVDEAGNNDSTSISRITFTKDTQAPAVDRIRVDGILAPSANPEIFVGLVSVPIAVTFTEPIVTPPDLTVTQQGGAATPTGRSAVTTRTITYVHGVTPGFDGPVQIDLAGGSDRAGNSVADTIERLFIVDTIPPSVDSVDPTDLTSISVSPERIRVRMTDPPAPAPGLTFSGVDLIGSTVTLFGPLESGGAMVMGTQTPFDPFTLDFVPAAPLTEEGTYRISVIAEDKVANRNNAFTSVFVLDLTALMLSDRNVVANPARGACVTDLTFPGAPQSFVEVRVDDPMFDANATQIVLRDFCRVPPEVPGQKVVVDASTIRYQLTDPIRPGGVDDGIYAIQVDAFDFAGNASPTFTTTFTVDTIAPSVAATFPTSRTAVNGPLRIVDATLLDENMDFCRRAGGIDQDATVMALTLLEPNPNTNITPANTQVQGTLRFQTIGQLNKILLEIVDSAGFPRGLRNDGGDDGLYQLSVEAFDCATNTSGMTISTFTYDTIRPVLTVNDLVDGGTLSGPDFTLTGTLVDNLGGSGVERVTITLEAVDAGGNVTTSPFLLDAPAVLDPTPLDAPQPTADWTFQGDLRRVPPGTRSRLRVRGFDAGGNFDEALFTVIAMEGTIPFPRLSAPASGAATSAQILVFSWDPVVTAARYRLRIESPNGDVIFRDTAAAETQLSVNLTGLPDPEGRFLWSVASIDGVGGVGPFSPNRPLFVDRVRPRVIAIDVLDPSPEAVGSINEGLVRLTLRFDEVMDPTRSPTVEVQLQNTSIPPLPVQILSYAGDILQGEFNIPEADALGRDPNGIAEVRVRNAFDRAGNVNIEPLGGITLFEVDTGPFWRVAVFKNPIDDQDVIVLAKGFQRDGGPGEDIVDNPSVVVFRQGQGDQAPTLHRVNQSSFRGAFRLDRRSIAQVTVRVAGRDQEGNTAQREIPLTVNRPSRLEDIRIQTIGLQIDIPAGAADEDTLLTVLDSLGALQPTAPGGELELVQEIAQVGPFGTELSHPARISVSPETLPEDRTGLGLFRKDSEGYVFLAPAGEQASTSRLAPLALLRDRTPPQLGTPQLAWRGSRLEVRVAATDGGAGLDAGASVVEVAGRRYRLRVEGDELVADVEGREGDPVTVRASDRLANTSSSVQALVPAPTFGFSEAAVVPNPARTRTTIRYRLNQVAQSVTADIYDAAGRRVARLSGPTGAGLQRLSWDLRSRRGRRVANGVYFVDLRADGGGRRARERLKVAVIR